MTADTYFIWGLFQQNTEAGRKNVSRELLFIDDMQPGEVACTINNEIHVGDDFIQGISDDMLKKYFNGVLYHEMANVWQWNGNNASNIGWLVEGIADFVRLKANYVPENWAKQGQGNSWTEGYSATAWFLNYCNIRNGFLNKKLRYGYSDNFFVELLGKTIEQLWNEYKAKYGN